MMFATFNPVQRSVRDAGFLAELGIRKRPTRLPQVLGELNIQAFSHPETVANMSYRMRDDLI